MAGTKKYLLPFLTVFLLFAKNLHSQLAVYDGFEAAGLNKIWAVDRMVDSSFTIQHRIVRSGNGAAMITLKSGNVFEAGKNGNKDSERDELREADKLISAEEHIYEYRFSLFLPDSFPIVPVRLVMAQWKQNCGGNPLCDDDSPVLSLRYRNGRLFIRVQNDNGDSTVFSTTEEVRNRWLDFVFKVKFTWQPGGFVQAWFNKKQVVNYSGATAYSSKKGYPAKSYFYFKTGLYRDLMQQPMTIYIDEYSKKEIIETIAGN